MSFLEQLQEEKKLSNTQLYLGAFGILLFLSLALTLPNYLVKHQTKQGNAQVVPTPAGATATINASPSAGIINVGTPFTVTVNVNGQGQAFNAAQATASVSSNLQITSLSTPSTSPCNFTYTETPTTANPSFAGAILATSSTDCNVYTLTLTPLSTGTGTINFTNASVKAYSDNSEILSSVQNGSYTLVVPTPTPTIEPPFTIGETNILPTNSNSSANNLTAQQTTLSQTATLQSLSVYVTNSSGNVRLGVYDATGPSGGPGARKAETNQMTPVAGWNTGSVITPVTLSPGTYWLAFLPSSNGLHFVRDATTGSNRFYSFAYGPMPATFSTTPTSGVGHWSLYATLTPGGITPTPTPTSTPMPTNTPSPTPTATPTPTPTPLPTSTPTPINTPTPTSTPTPIPPTPTSAIVPTNTPTPDVPTSTPIPPTPTPTLIPPDVASTQSPTYQSNILLSGTKENSISSVYVNDSTVGVTYPTSTTWQTTLDLNLGTNLVSIYGRDSSDNQSPTTSIIIDRHRLGDINGDTSIDLTDISLFASDWLKSSNLNNALSDMDGNGLVDLTDFSIIAKQYGQ